MKLLFLYFMRGKRLYLSGKQGFKAVVVAEVQAFRHKARLLVIGKKEAPAFRAGASYEGKTAYFLLSSLIKL